jgi:hypothetical protein
MTGLGLSSLDQSGRERGACLDAVEGVVSDGYFGSEALQDMGEDATRGDCYRGHRKKESSYCC